MKLMHGKLEWSHFFKQIGNIYIEKSKRILSICESLKNGLVSFEQRVLSNTCISLPKTGMV